MSKWSLVTSVWLLLVNFTVTPTFGTEPQSALQLVSADVAICLEIPGLDQTWSELEAGPLMARLRAFPPFQRLLESPGFQQWQMVNQQIAGQTGTTLSQALRQLFARSLVVAIDVPPEGQPRGILIGEAQDESAIQSAIGVWKKLEPNALVTKKSHHGTIYFRRERRNSPAETVYFAVANRWFAISDHEPLIHDVIDRFVAISDPSTSGDRVTSLPTSPLFTRAQQRLKKDAVAYIHINARPWDRGLAESSKDDKDPVDVAAVWKRVTWVSASLHLDQGIVCETLIDLDNAKLPDDWSEFVAVASANSYWFQQIPAESLLAITGCVELTPLVQFLLDQVPAHEQAEFAAVRRVARSLFGGQDLLNTIIPILGRDFGGFVTTRKDNRTLKTTLDGAIGFTLGSLAHEVALRDFDHGLEAGLRLLAAYHSAEGQQVVTVKREQRESVRLRSLSEEAPFPIAYGISRDKLVIAGSPERLQKSLVSLDQSQPEARLKVHANRFFPAANQLIWFDAALTRQVLEQSGEELANSLTFGSEEDAERLTKRFEQVRRLLEVVDSVFVAARIESDRISLSFGGGLDQP